MRIYLAGRYIRLPELSAYRRELEAMGYEVTSRWLLGQHEIPEGIDCDSHLEYAQRFAAEDYEDLEAADCCIAFTEGGPLQRYSRGGRHVELGMAIAWGKRVIVVGPRENVFCALPQVEQFHTWAGLRAAIDLGCCLGDVNDDDGDVDEKDGADEQEDEDAIREARRVGYSDAADWVARERV